MIFKISSLICLCATLSSCATDTSSTKGPSIVARPNATGINQVPINRQGCGPIALLNAYKFGTPRWNAALGKLRGDSDKKHFNDLVNNFGRKLSNHLHGTIRWSDTRGINSPDLVDLANDFQRVRKLDLPKLKLHSLFLSGKQTHAQLLRLTHKKFKQSLAKGYPPIISIKRYAYNPNSRFPRWRQHFGHFVVVHEVPDFIPAQAVSFTIKYIDPWGGTIKSGEIMIPTSGFFALDTSSGNARLRRSPTLAIAFPQTSLGKHSLGKNDRSTTIIDATIIPE